MFLQSVSVACLAEHFLNAVIINHFRHLYLILHRSVQLRQLPAEPMRYNKRYAWLWSHISHLLVAASSTRITTRLVACERASQAGLGKVIPRTSYKFTLYTSGLPRAWDPLESMS